MAQTITAYRTDGIFKSSGIALDSVTDAKLTASLKDAKDCITVLVELPSTATGNTSLVFAPAEEATGDKGVTIPLTAGTINHLLITTKGIKKNDGSAEFTFTNSNGTAVNQLGIKMCFVKHSAVLNH